MCFRDSFLLDFFPVNLDGDMVLKHSHTKLFHILRDKCISSTFFCEPKSPSYTCKSYINGYTFVLFFRPMNGNNFLSKNFLYAGY